jgi:hypothetical protein
MIFLSLLLIPILVAIGFFVFTKHTITMPEFLGHAGLSVLVAGASVGIIYWSNTSDVEVWNGHVNKKQQERVSCSHSYRCHCYQSCSGSGSSRSCHQVCSTCYEHSFDYDWAYYTTDDGRSTISRVNRQGTQEPPRFTTVVVGEPTASSHSFTNYIKAAPDSLFNKKGLVEQYKAQLPKYPGDVYDYYRINRLVLVGVNVPDSQEWNRRLMEQNDRLGASKEVTMGIVLVRNKPHDYFNALEQHWLGGKQNDAILAIGVDDQNNFVWADSMAWTDNKIFHINLRDAVLDYGKLDIGLVDIMAHHVNESFVRKPMEYFEYLRSSVTPSAGQWVFAVFINLLLSIGLGVFFHSNDIREWRNT